MEVDHGFQGALPTAMLSLGSIFDLANDLIVARYSSVTRRSWEERWPVRSLDTKGIDQPERLQYPSPQWRFRSDVQKVVARLAHLAPERDKTHLVQCSAMQYAIECVFQRMLAWGVWGDVRTRTKGPALDPRQMGHFQYHNRFANVRSLLAMPLLRDLAHEMGTVIVEGNYAFQPADTKEISGRGWVYPQLTAYLASFSYPGIPRTVRPHCCDKAHEDPLGCAIQRALERTKDVSAELWDLLVQGESLWKGIRFSKPTKDPDARAVERRVERLEDVGEACFGSQEANEFLSPFVRCLVKDADFSLKDLWQGRARSGAGEIARDVNELFRLAQRERGSLVRRFLEEVHGALSFTQDLDDELNEALGAAGQGTPGHGCAGRLREAILSLPDDFNRPRTAQTDGDPHRETLRNDVGLFFQWRILETQLRLVVDRLFLQRRREEPPLVREHYPRRFEMLGFRGLQAAELQFIDHLERIVSPEQSDQAEAGVDDPLEFQADHWLCEDWLASACQRLRGKDEETAWGDLWRDREYPRHALFFTFLRAWQELRWDGRSESRGSPAWTRALEPFCAAMLLSHVIPPPGLESFPEQESPRQQDSLARIRRLVRRWLPDFDRPFSQGQPWLARWPGDWHPPHVYAPWSWLRRAIDKRRLDQASLDDVRFCSNSPVVRDELGARGRASLEELQARAFFSWQFLPGGNVPIFRALHAVRPQGDPPRRNAHHGINIRLIASEKAGVGPSKETPTESELAEQHDYADFVGSYQSIKKESDPPPSRTGAAGDRDSEVDQALRRQKLYLRMLGTALLAEIRAQSAQREAAWSRLYAIGIDERHRIIEKLREGVPPGNIHVRIRVGEQETVQRNLAAILADAFGQPVSDDPRRALLLVEHLFAPQPILTRVLGRMLKPGVYRKSDSFGLSEPKAYLGASATRSALEAITHPGNPDTFRWICEQSEEWRKILVTAETDLSTVRHLLQPTIGVENGDNLQILDRLLLAAKAVDPARPTDAEPLRNLVEAASAFETAFKLAHVYAASSQYPVLDYLCAIGMRDNVPLPGRAQAIAGLLGHDYFGEWLLIEKKMRLDLKLSPDRVKLRQICVPAGSDRWHLLVAFADEGRRGNPKRYFERDVDPHEQVSRHTLVNVQKALKAYCRWRVLWAELREPSDKIYTAREHWVYSENGEAGPDLPGYLREHCRDKYQDYLDQWASSVSTAPGAGSEPTNRGPATWHWLDFEFPMPESKRVPAYDVSDGKPAHFVDL